MDRSILCLRKESNVSILGLFSCDLEYALELIENQRVFVSRHEAENDPRYFQVIPYVLVYLQNNPSVVLGSVRLSRSGEERLHGKLSIGFGGHIEILEDNEEVKDMVFRTAIDELREEICLNADPGRLNFHGLLSYTADPVGEVHLGLLFSYGVTLEEFESIAPGEPDKLLLYWTTTFELYAFIEKLENWSRLVLVNLMAGELELK